MNTSARHATGLAPYTSYEEKFLTSTVVVCTRNRPDSLRACLKGLSQLDHLPHEVIVVDNSLGDEATRRVANEFGARYVLEPQPGLSRARNRGLAESRSDVVAYLDDDAIPDTHWLGTLLEPFNDPQVSLVTGRIVRSDARPGWNSSQPPRTLSNQDPEWFEIATFGGLGLGSNMVFRRNVGDNGDIFDERLGRGAPFEIAEENYAFALVLSRGAKAVFVPAAVVFHPPGKPADIRQEARNLIAFSILLLAEFPDRRSELIRFMYRRVRRKPLTWPRDSPDPGEIITSGWPVLFSASFSAALLFFKTKKPRKR